MSEQHADDARIADLIDQWHEGDDPRPLWEFLGWTEEAYAAWVVAHADGWDAESEAAMQSSKEVTKRMWGDDGGTDV